MFANQSSIDINGASGLLERKSGPGMKINGAIAEKVECQPLELVAQVGPVWSWMFVFVFVLSQ